mmetsp:Transcript_103202/g.328241  ORF Transcript_103202/g.328241 Transcript_103202/m.328241 type:complete len:223 (-) Transcript_103202:838-1506(-)
MTTCPGTRRFGMPELPATAPRFSSASLITSSTVRPAANILNRPMFCRLKRGTQSSLQTMLVMLLDASAVGVSSTGGGAKHTHLMLGGAASQPGASFESSLVTSAAVPAPRLWPVTRSPYPCGQSRSLTMGVTREVTCLAASRMPAWAWAVLPLSSSRSSMSDRRSVRTSAGVFVPRMERTASRRSLSKLRKCAGAPGAEFSSRKITSWLSRAHVRRMTSAFS